MRYPGGVAVSTTSFGRSPDRTGVSVPAPDGGEIIDVMTGFLIGYVVAASGDDERTRIGERYGIRVVPG